jgi:hypothetical protein
MSEKRMTRDRTSVEAALSSLHPAPTGVDRDRLMYLAGRAAADGSPGARRLLADWLWPVATAASLLLAVTFATMWVARGGPRIVYVERPAQAQKGVPQATAPPTEAAEPEPKPRQKRWRTEYLQLRRLVTTRGVEAIPEMRSAPASDVETLRWRSAFDRTLEELLEG